MRRAVGRPPSDEDAHEPPILIDGGFIRGVVTGDTDERGSAVKSWRVSWSGTTKSHHRRENSAVIRATLRKDILCSVGTHF